MRERRSSSTQRIGIPGDGRGRSRDDRRTGRRRVPPARRRRTRGCRCPLLPAMAVALGPGGRCRWCIRPLGDRPQRQGEASDDRGDQGPGPGLPLLRRTPAALGRLLRMVPARARRDRLDRAPPKGASDCVATAAFAMPGSMPTSTGASIRTGAPIGPTASQSTLVASSSTLMNLKHEESRSRVARDDAGACKR